MIKTMPTMSPFIIWESWRHIMLWLCFCIVHVLCWLTSCVQGCGLSTVNKVLFDWFYYRAMLCIRGTSHGPVSACLSVRPSVCLSVTSRCSTKTAKRRITQTIPHDSPGTLVFWSQRSPRNSTGVTPYGGTKCRWGGSKSATFDK